MTDLVLLHHNEPMTTSLALAEGTENTHKSVIQLVRKYVDDLQEFGTLAFEMRKSGGLPTEIAYLNEPQATLLITYLRNSEIVRRFKIALVKAFYEMRDRLAASPVPTFTTTNLGHGADLAVAADRTFRGFLRSARAAGLRLPQALKVANLQTMSRTGMNMLAELGLKDAPAPESSSDLGVTAFCEAWLSGALPMPATICRSADLYTAYRHWRGSEQASPVNRFSVVLLAAHPAIKKRHVSAQLCGRDLRVRCFVVGNPLTSPDHGPINRYSATEIERFSVALSDWMARKN